LTGKPLKAAVIGLGVIGCAQMRLLGPMVRAAYDIKTGEPYPGRVIRSCDFAVICVGTPPGDDDRADLSALRAALKRLPASMPVMIRSTVPPGTTASLEASGRLVVHVPEFMQERSDGMWREPSDVPFLICGGSKQAIEWFQPVLAQIAGGPVWCCSGLEAELVKYTANAYLAAKVTFVNEISRVCKAFGADWETVRQGWLHDPRAGISHTETKGHEPGFGGSCLPKDLSALICASMDAGYYPYFLTVIKAANAGFRAEGTDGDV
jgi:UDPglucose 6-dehydrogenase